MESHPAIGDVRGTGLLFGVEFVENRETREPDALTASYVMQRMKSQGVLVSTDGPHRNVVKMKPPLCFTEEDCDTLVNAMDFAIQEFHGTAYGKDSMDIAPQGQAMELQRKQVEALQAKLKAEEEKTRQLELSLLRTKVHELELEEQLVAMAGGDTNGRADAAARKTTTTTASTSDSAAAQSAEYWAKKVKTLKVEAKAASA